MLEIDKHRIFAIRWQSVGLVIQKLLTPGSIPGLVMRRCVLRKALYANFLLGPRSYGGRCGGQA